MKPTPNPPRRPDPFALGVRFGCGVLLGTFLAIAFVWDGMTLQGAIITIVILAPLCGILAAWLGDKFWHFIGSWFR